MPTDADFIPEPLAIDAGFIPEPLAIAGWES